jgi:hypothetical protein
MTAIIWRLPACSQPAINRDRSSLPTRLPAQSWRT